MTQLISVSLVVIAAATAVHVQEKTPPQELRYATHTHTEWLSILQTDLDVETRQKALSALVVLNANGGDPEDKGFDATMQCLRTDRSWTVRLKALRATGSYFKVPDERKVREIFTAFRVRGPGHPTGGGKSFPGNQRTYSEARDALSRLIRSNLKQVSEESIRLLEESDTSNRILACRLLSYGEMPFRETETVLPALVRASKDKDVHVRHTALIGLLTIVERSEPRTVSRRGARIQALEFVGVRRDEAIDQIIKAIMTRHRDRDIRIRIEAAMGIQYLGGHATRVLPSLVAELDHQTTEIQRALALGEDPAPIWSRVKPAQGDLQEARRSDGTASTPHLSYVEALVVAIGSHGAQSEAAVGIMKKLAAAPSGTELDRTIKAAHSVLAQERNTGRSMSLLMQKLISGKPTF